MRIEIETELLMEADGLALAVLVHRCFPHVIGLVAMMAGASQAALNTNFAGESLDAARVFADGPPDVIPAAEEAFAPQSDGASQAIGPAGAGASISATGTAGDTTSTTATNGASPSSVPVDADGLPWDARIHAGGQAQTKDGKWRKRKGVGADTVATVEAELRARLTGPLASTTAGAPPPPASDAPTSLTTPATPAVPAAPAAATAPAAPPAQAAPPPPTTTGAPATPPAPPAPAPTTSTTPGDAGAPPAPFPPDVAAQALAAAATGAGIFQEGQAPAVVFTKTMKHITDNDVTPEEIGSACAAVGIDSPRRLLADPSKAPDFVATLDALIAARA